MPAKALTQMRGFLPVAALLLVALAGWMTSWATGDRTPTARAAAAIGCPEEAEEAGDEGGAGENAAPTFSAAFHRVRFTIDASTDGFEGKQLPIAIEQVCDVPPRFQLEAAQLSGGDGIALISSRTRVRQDQRLVRGRRRTTALAGADTVVLSVRLVKPAHWREDEDGAPIATFQTSRVYITD